MEQSILDSTKKTLGIDKDYTAFDLDVITHINSVFSTLNQLGIGPDHGFMIEDAAPTWADFLGTDLRLNSVKSYTYLRVRLLFDPPATSFHIASMENQIKELEWRLLSEKETRSTTLAGEHKRIIGNLGDEYNMRLTNPEGQTLINANGTYQAEFVSSSGRKAPAKLDMSQKADGILFLSAVIQDGVYTVRSLTPRRTLLVLEVGTQ